MRKYLSGLLALVCLAGLSSCGRTHEVEKNLPPEEYRNLYTTQVQYTGEDDPAQYLEIAVRSARQTGGQVEDPVVQIYTANIHCNYAHSFMTQWVYFPSDAGDAEKAYQEVFPIIQTCGAEKSVQKVVSLVKG